MRPGLVHFFCRWSHRGIHPALPAVNGIEARLMSQGGRFRLMYIPFNTHLVRSKKKKKKLLTSRGKCTIISTVEARDNASAGYAPLAQLVEHLTLNQGVQGSSP